jgi:putative DNA primase/helicase
MDCVGHGKRIVPDRIFDADPELHEVAEAEREKHRVSRLEVADARPPEFSDEALALRFSEKHAGTVQYVAVWNRWLRWNGYRWEFDTTMWTYDRARAVCRVASTETDQRKLAAAVASAKTVAAVVSLARADRRHAATVEQWDVDPWSLNTP